MTAHRVMHVISGLSTGGAETMLVKLLSTLDRSRFEPVVVSLQGRGTMGSRLEAAGIDVETIGLRTATDLPAALWRLARAARRYEPDLIQGWMYHGNVAALLAAAAASRRSPVIWNIRQSITSLNAEKPATAFVIRRGARMSGRAAAIVYNSRNSARQHEDIGYRADRRHIIPNGFDCDRFAPSPELRHRFRSELGVADDVPLIGLLARYHPVKDHANFLAAGARLAADTPRARFVLAGHGVDPDNAALMKLVDELGLRDRVHLLGERADTNALLAALDIATSSSRDEAFPNVLGEAMACGVACVATDVGDCRVVLGDSGIVVPPRDAAALAAAWRALLEGGAEERRRLGSGARDRVLEHYSIERVAEAYAALYGQTLAAAAEV